MFESLLGSRLHVRLPSVYGSIGLLLLLVQPLFATARMATAKGTSDTVRLYNANVSRVAYNDNTMKRQCLRLRFPASTKVTSLTVWLQGPAGKAGSVEFFGHEGGLLAPRLEQPLRPAIELVKTRQGREAVSVDLEEGIVHLGGQLFICVGNLQPGVQLLCAGKEEEPECSEVSGQGRYSSIQQLANGTWVSTGFAPWIDVVIESPERKGGSFVRDTLTDDLSDRRRVGERYISCFDLDGDGRVDIACAGVLLMNRTKGFVPFDLGTGIYAFGCDIDADGRDELLTMNADGDDHIAISEITARGTVVGRGKIPLGCYIKPHSMSQLDINADGRTDIIIAGRNSEKNAEDIILLSSTTRGFTSRSLMDDDVKELNPSGDGNHIVVQFLPADVQTRAIEGANQRGRLLVRAEMGDLIIPLHATETGEIWRTTISERTDVVLGSRSSFVRDSTLLLPMSIHWTDAQTYARNFQRLPYEEKLSAFVVTDLDNDGHDETLLFAEGTCRFLRVFSERSGSLMDVTDEFGLSGIDDCPDGTIADLDLDGRLDLIIDRRGRLEIWMNRLSVKPSMVSILSSDIDAVKIHHRAAAYDKESWIHTATISGRGRLIQDVRFVQCTPNVDSIAVTWSDPTRTQEVVTLPKRVIVAGQGKALEPMSDDRPMSVSFQDQHLIIDVAREQSAVKLSVITADGRNIGHKNFRQLSPGLHAIEIDEVTGPSVLSSGQYTAVVSSDQCRVSCMIVIIR